MPVPAPRGPNRVLKGHSFCRLLTLRLSNFSKTSPEEMLAMREQCCRREGATFGWTQKGSEGRGGL